MAKSSKSRVPKRMMGVKVPKVIRKSGALETVLNNPIARAALAEALVAAAGAAATVLLRQSPAAAGAAHARDAASEAGSDLGATAKEVAKGAAGAVAGVVIEAGRKMLAGTDDNASAQARHRRESDARHVGKKDASHH